MCVPGNTLVYRTSHNLLCNFQALCRITHHNPQVFQSVIDTVGMTTILSALSFGITRIQQSIVTMFGALIASGQHLNRMVQDKVCDFVEFLDIRKLYYANNVGWKKGKGVLISPCLVVDKYWDVEKFIYIHFDFQCFCLRYIFTHFNDRHFLMNELQL